MHDYGEQLALMEPSFPAPQALPKGDDSTLRWAVRSKDDSGFIFVNNYERLQNLSAKKDVELEACGVKLPRLTIPAGAMAVFPVNVDGIRYATAQIVAHRDGKIYLMQLDGIPATIALQNGKTLKNVKPKGTAKAIYNNVYLLTRDEAEHLFLPANSERTAQAKPPFGESPLELTCTKVREAGPLRTIVKGKAKVAEAPSEADWQQAAVYRVSLPAEALATQPLLLSITYQGDCARLYADGKLIADNFQYGRPFLYGLWRLPKDVKTLELRIMPMQQDAPVYLPREADKTPGERVKRIEIINRN